MAKCHSLPVLPVRLASSNSVWFGCLMAIVERDWPHDGEKALFRARPTALPVADTTTNTHLPLARRRQRCSRLSLRPDWLQTQSNVRLGNMAAVACVMSQKASDAMCFTINPNPMKYMLATACSNPAATKAAIGNTVSIARWVGAGWRATTRWQDRPECYRACPERTRGRRATQPLLRRCAAP